MIPFPLISNHIVFCFFDFLVLAKGGRNVKATTAKFARKSPVHSFLYKICLS